MKKITRLLLLVLLLTGAPRIFAQIDSTFEQIQEALEAQFESMAMQNEEEFNLYVETIDREFAEYLKQTWEQFRLFAAIRPDSTPKPILLPKYDPGVTPLLPKEVLLQPAAEPAPIPPVPNVPVILKTEPEEAAVAELSIDFYGRILYFSYDPALSVDFPAVFTNREIAGFWETASQANYSALVTQATQAGIDMNLNDWGIYLLVNQLTAKIANSTNTSRLLAWYILTKAGYKIRVAYADNKIYLLFPSSTKIYGIKYFLFDQIPYYAPDFPGEQVVTYERDFPDATRIMDLNIYNALNIGDNYAERSFVIPWESREYRLSIKYNLNSVEFFKDYPLCELKVYFDAAISPLAKESILQGISPITDKLSKPSAVNFLLNFVQNGFAYKIDPEQFNGMEKFFFPEEDFYYPFSDCDDRAVLFAYLVRELLGLKVVGVEYPGHVATAVHFPTEVEGDYILWKDEKYIIADPTYINAPLGMTMPGMINEKARIIDLVNEQNATLQLASVWQKAESCGGKQGDNQQTMVTDPEGNSYLTGYFNGEAVFGATTLNSIAGKNDIFVAGFNSAGIPVWAIQAGGDGNDLGYNIAMDKQGDLYVTGSFHGTIRFGNRSLKAPVYTDLYMAKYTSSGKLLWAGQAQLDTSSETSDYIFVASFTPEGKHLGTKLYPDDGSFSNFGISFDTAGNVYYTASYTSTVGLNIDLISLGLETGFNVVSTLKEETDKQLTANTEKTIAGLFAAINLIRINNISLSGKAVQDAFQRYNPAFISAGPKVYDCICRVHVMKNTEGIVTVSTLDKESVILDKIKILNDARLKVTMLPTGDAKIEILGGVKVGKAFIWFPLNFVKLIRATGDVLFDYDDDHSQVTLNMKKDMIF